MALKEQIKILLKKIARKEIRVIREPVPVDKEFEGRKAIVFGGTGGIGNAIAEALIKRGAKVLITGSTQKSVDMALNLLPKSVVGMVLDVTSAENIEPAFKKATGLLGGVDMVVYCAGVHGDEDFGMVTVDAWDKIMSVNLKGAYFSCQAAGNYMVANKVKGRILVVGSASALKPGWTPYEISKRGVQSLVLGMADKLAPYGITVNCVAPGPVATKMLGRSDSDDLCWPANPSGRLATPEEVAELSAYMLSDLGSLIIGDSFYITGGSGTVSNR